MFVKNDKEEMKQVYIPNYNFSQDSKAILLVITDEQRWHCLAVKKFSALFLGITSKHNANYYCINCLNPPRTENKLEPHENACKHHDYCYIDTPEKGKNILKYNHGEKSIKIPFVIYVDTQSLLEKLDTCYNKRKSSRTKVNKQTACGKSLFTPCSFDSNKNQS